MHDEPVPAKLSSKVDRRDTQAADVARRREVLQAPGQRLRSVREDLRLSFRDVEAASSVIAQRHSNDDFFIPISRLSDIETKGVVPTPFRFYSLAVIYRRDIRDLLAWYGIDVNDFPADLSAIAIGRTHLVQGLGAARFSEIPTAIDPGFDPAVTTDFGRLILEWGRWATPFVRQLKADPYTYAYIGTNDYTMFPLLPPGSFVQVDETRNRVTRGPWRSEIERPIYLVETREGFVCSWCELRGDLLILHSHPTSNVATRTYRHPQDAEVVGQVIGAAIRFPAGPALESKAGAPKPPESSEGEGGSA